MQPHRAGRFAPEESALRAGPIVCYLAISAAIAVALMPHSAQRDPDSAVAGLSHFLLACALPPAASADTGLPMFYIGEGGTNARSQSKCWFADSTWWCALLDGSDSYFYRLEGSVWRQQLNPGPFNSLDHARADVCPVCDTVYVLMGHDTFPRLHKFVYQDGVYAPPYGWHTPLGFDFSSQAATLAVDSRSRIWIVYEANAFPNSMHAIYSTDGDRTFAEIPFDVSVDGAGQDDICAVTAFAGDRIGVFWSDQHNGYFGFRVHRDDDPPDLWQSIELVASEPVLVDGHLNLAVSSDGRVFAVVKTSHDTIGETMVGLFVREVDGAWSDLHQVCAYSDSSEATKPIVLLSESENRIYVLYTNRAVTPSQIECRWSDMDEVSFGQAEILICLGGEGGLGRGLDHVSSMKGNLTPETGLLAIATEMESRMVYYNIREIPPVNDDPWDGFPCGANVCLCAYPNPAPRGDQVVRILYRDLSGQSGSHDGWVMLQVVDHAGRMVRMLRAPVPAQDGTLLEWNGRDGCGRMVPSGIYWAVVTAGGARASTSIVWIR
jgi:hypothetical protein